VAGVRRDAIVADYAATSERIERIIDRLMQSPTYVDNLRGRPMSSHLTRPETMISLLSYIDDTFGGVEDILIKMGWTDDDSQRLRVKLRN
jgi:hypothetical protein